MNNPPPKKMCKVTNITEVTSYPSNNTELVNGKAETLAVKMNILAKWK